MRRGQAPIPTELHKQRGSYNPTRHGRDRAREPKPKSELQNEPPPGLTANQRAEWRHQVQHFPRGVLRECDRRWLLIWVQAADRLDLANQALQRENTAHPDHPFQVEDDKGNWRTSPLINVIAKAELTLTRATGELGFSPAARTRIHAAPATSEPAAAPAWGTKIAA